MTKGEYLQSIATRFNNGEIDGEAYDDLFMLANSLEFEDDDYTPSSSNGDYGPSNPWDAPGMSIRDFI